MLNARKPVINLLLDSGSDVSILKINIPDLNGFVNVNNPVKLNGITANSISTLGRFVGQLKFEDILLAQTFYLVTSAFPIVQDGLLGRDFLQQTSAILDYSRNSIQLFGKINYPFNANFQEIPYEPPILSQIELDLLQVRLEKLMKLLSLDTQIADKGLVDIIRNFNTTFYLEGDQLSYTNTVEHRIDIIPGSAPINIRPYRIAVSQYKEMESQVQKWLSLGIIQRSRSAYNAPLVLVKKKSDDPTEVKWRLCVDFRKLNEITIKVASPVPRISEILDRLGRSKWYSCLDLASGYHQVLMAAPDRCKTAFSLGNNHFEFLRMGFGLATAPATFIALINIVVEGLDNVLVYLDDIIIFAESIEQHNKMLVAVLERLQKHNLSLQPEKCKLLLTEVNYLGHRITRDGITIEERSISAVKTFPIPKNAKQVRSFVGFANYYRQFIQDFAERTKPLTNLTKKNVKFVWSPECQLAMEYLIKQITSSPILQAPDFEKEFILTTDASNFAIGAVLSQGEIGSDKPIAFYSRTLLDAETRYSTIEQEMLAIVASIRHFRVYLLCHRFCIVTDHNPLVYIRSSPNQNGRIMRWRLDLEEYDFYVVHKSGVQNTNADFLSRIRVADEEPVQDNNVRVVTRSQARKEIVDKAPTEILNTIEEDTKDDDMGILLGVSPLDISFDGYKEYINKNTISNLQVLEIAGKLPVKHKKHLVDFISIDDQINLDRVDETTDEIVVFTPEIHVEQTKQGPNLLLTVRKSSYATILMEDLFKALQLLVQFCVNENISEIILDFSKDKIFPLEYRILLNVIKFLTKEVVLAVDLYQCEVEFLTNKDRIKEVMVDFHSSLLAGHQGKKRTLHKIRQYYDWENINRDVLDFVGKCELCQKIKRYGQKTAPLKITSTAHVPFEKISLDIVGPLPTSLMGNNYLLTFQDDLTKFLAVIPVPNQSAETIAREFTENILLIYSAPREIRTDRGANFLSQVFRETCKFWKCKKVNTTAYRPQSNSALERSHSVVKDYLRSFVNHQPATWDEFAKSCSFAYNTSVHSATGYTPFELLFGFKPRLPGGVHNPPEIVYNYDNYVIDLKNKLQNSYLIARDRLILAKKKSKKIFDQKTKVISFNVGEYVLLRKPDSGLGHKELTPRWSGPYLIENVPSELNCEIRVGNKLQRVHINRLKLFLED